MRSAASNAPKILRLLWLTGLLLLGACEREKRDLDAAPPATPPTGPADPRAALYQQNAYQVSQGGRLFGWYGCQGCHGDDAKGVLNLADGQWRYGGDPAAVYASIAQGRPGGMPAYAGRIPPEEIWQLTGYTLQLYQISAPQRRRQDLDQAGEPQGTSWTGAVR